MLVHIAITGWPGFRGSKDQEGGIGCKKQVENIGLKANYVFDHYLKIEGQPDLVHVHSMLNAGVLASQIKEKYQIPYVITEHSSWFARRLISKQQQVIIQRVAMSAKTISCK